MLLALLALVSLTVASPFGVFQQGTTTKLLGTSFGVPGQNESYDYVVVGGGTAGLAIAERLAEDPAVSVAVVEPGSFYELDNGNVNQIPVYHPANRDMAPEPSSVQPLID